jgi:hypothetical protein
LIAFVPGLLIALIVGVPVLSQTVGNTEDLSTIYRFYMTANLVDYDLDSLLFGVGVARWHGDLSSFLSWTPNAEDFFVKRANPHFLPTEVVIYGGMISLGIFIYILHRSLRNSPIAPFLITFFCASFFTTNTGVERIFVSITFFLAIWSSILSYQLEEIYPAESR